MGVPTKRLSGKLFYTHHLVPNIDFKTLTIMRSSQAIAIAIAFLFVPITTLAYLTLRTSENAYASALFTMFRHVAGSIGIAPATVSIVERTQANIAHMSEHMTPLNANYNDSIQRLTRTLMDMGQTMQQAMTTAIGPM
jgi:DHA2 family multidrug resistance protein